ncbi:hypothetical protein E2562_024937 [Oryza meyeriana var. granulata]|uniref:RING-type domain-containing protein n=1 Tax=Oryza meyeriana var. granulata TaxID=110450 RepID=A0A6G1DN42_9ORYZ|nr:hypothetical protein E2562_024937 [Oryza meyeriana var. granulata]KAF0913856.1 hypothetical protein E2562_024937 [Oryza meyeriana var. granulata]KAF0913858.1 hypothetical protein E2562_024937 [Oryza meyeriana var. granulata]KAF0913861.1 hypothetical protein E2562_024937 [Oryza meyeriana var. granulata]
MQPTCHKQRSFQLCTFWHLLKAFVSIVCQDQRVAHHTKQNKKMKPYYLLSRRVYKYFFTNRPMILSEEEQSRPTQLGELKIFSCRILNIAFVHTPRVEMHSRRILLHTPFSGQPSGPSQPVSRATAVEGGSPGSNFDANIVMILAVLLCALICALGLNSIVRCALRCSSRMVVDPEPNRVTRLAQSGLRRKALRSMPILLYSAGLKLNAVSPMCAICLSDFEAGEHVRVLPKCNHGFHVRCIDRWLLARSTCPTCRQSLFGAPQKASGCSESEGNQAEPAPARPVLVPLRPEGKI